MTGQTKNPPERDDKWLLSRLDFIWSKFFEDVVQENPVHVKFGRYSKFRLGSIKLDKRSNRSYITITSMFKNVNIPVEVIDHTLAHELAHYAHGFSSKKIRLHKYPHVGGVVHKEMEKRGIGYLTKAYKDWVLEYRKILRKAYGY